MTDPHPLLGILDCPGCLAGSGLVPQGADGNAYLACARCEHWYPIRDDVAVLLPPDRNPGAERRPVGEELPLLLDRRPPRAVDAKALVYSFFARLHEFATAFELEREGLVVDVGCSTGSLAAVLRPEQMYVGFDLSFESLRFARRMSGGYFVQADAERLPIKTGSVPFFVSRETLEHVGNVGEAVRELCRIGRRGVVVLPTLDFPFLYDPVNWALIRRGHHARFGIYGYDHESLFDIAGWRQVLERGGFAVRSECAIGTGLLLNGFDIFWHALYSWRKFDNLPRHAVPIELARLVFPLWRAEHDLDRRLLPGSAASHAFEVVPTDLKDATP